jgi:5-methylcytosine-specific restriction endonuclease McrA
MNLQEMTDDQLHVSTLKTADRQREVTLDLLNHLNEVERRHLFSKFNCSSLHGYCVQELKMTSGTACHHIDAARLLKQLPQLEEKLMSGAIAMTTVANAESFFKREARSGNRFDNEKKQSVLAKLESISTKEAEKVLISHSSNPEIHLKEKVTQKTESIVELKVHLDEETMAMLERLKEIWSHAMPHATFSDLIKRAAKEAVEKNDPLKRAERSEARANKPKEPKTPPTGSSNGTSPPTGSKAEIRRQVWKRDQAQCTFIYPRTGERCGAKHFVEEDHIVPKAMGGQYTTENIRLRCRAHNQRHAINCYGNKKMRQFLN